ncbi:MAG: hypothetical protein Q9207_002139 [Kuettlingeria erythrocarpa]
MDCKYIREEKLSLTRNGGLGAHEPFLMLVLNPLDQGMKIEQPGAAMIINNLFCISHNWAGVMDALDEQTTLPSSIIFNGQARQNILFEDGNFSNSKRYFWALQSLRLFAEHMEVTLRSIDGIVLMTQDLGHGRDFDACKKVTDLYQKKFEHLRDRVERKRQEIQSLSDGLFSASSVAEGRLATEQNGNIRLLTLVTIAYLPLTFAASVYGMDALPKSAGFRSYFVVTALMCAITYILVLKLRQVKEAISWGCRCVRSLPHTRKKREAVQKLKDHEMASPVATRASSMA